jgi:uncharacterized membrane protein YfcA
MSEIDSKSNNIAAALFMIIGALIGVMIMALVVPARDRGLLELKLGLAIGAFIGYAIFRLVAYLLEKNRTDIS